MTDRERRLATKIAFVVGSRWSKELAALYARSDHRPVNHTIDLDILSDVIDLDIGDRNLTECISRERVFPFISDLLAALARSRHSPTQKVFIESGDEPWEFAILGRDPDAVWFSLYGIDSGREIICHDLPLHRGALERAALDAAEVLLTELARVAPGLSDAREATRLRASRDALEVARKIDLSSSFSTTSHDASTHEREGGSEHHSGWGLRYRYDAGGLVGDGSSKGARARSAHPLDLHTLLCRGAVVLEHHGAARLTLGPYPFLVIGALTRQLAHLLGVAKPLGVASTHLLLEPRRGAGKRALVVVKDPAILDSNAGVELELIALAELAVEFAELMRRDFQEVAPHLSGNRRFTEVFDRLEAIRDALRVRGVSEPRAGVSSGEPVEAHGEVDGASVRMHDVLGEDLLEVVHEGGDFPWKMSRVLAMHPHLTWVLSQDDLRLRRVVLAPGRDGDVLVVGTERGVIGVDASSGEQLWRFEQGAVRLGALFLHGARYVVHQTQHDEVVVLDVNRGTLVHRLVLPRAHRIVAAVDYKIADVAGVVLLEERGAITALDLDAGEVRWHRSGKARGAALHAWSGDVVVTMQAGMLTCVEPDNGEVRWEVEAGHYARQVCMHQGRAVVIGAGAHRAQTNVRSFEVTDGARRQELSLDGYFLGPARSFGDDLWLMIERGRRPVVESLRGKALDPAWVRPLREQMRTLIPAWIEVEVRGERGVLIQTAASQTVLLRHEDGIPLWSRDSAPITRAPLAPVPINEGFLVLGDALELRQTSNGELLYRFDGFLDEPCVMIARGSLDVILGEQSLDGGAPTVLCLSFAHYLALV